MAIVKVNIAGGLNVNGVQFDLLALWNIATPVGVIYTRQIQNVTDIPIPVPAGSTICIIFPDPKINALNDFGPDFRLKGIAADTGGDLKAVPAVIPVTGMTQFFVNAAVGATFTWTFIFL